MLITCTGCHSTKPATREFFYESSSCKHGLNPRCRGCVNAQRGQWKHRNRDRLAAVRRAQYAERYRDQHRALEDARRERFPYRIQAERLKSGVAKRSLEFGFTVPVKLRKKAYFEEWLRRQPNCDCCGVELAIGKKNQHGPLPNSPSIDRLNPALGYEIDNISLICWRCNNIKRDYTAADLRKVAQWIEQRSSRVIHIEGIAA